MKGIKVEPEVELQIDLDVTSYIPDEYISDADQKIEIYQNIALCHNEQDIQNVVDEIIDRFGNMPAEVENLIAIARIKYLAKQLKVSKISSTKQGQKANSKAAVVFTFEPNQFKMDLNELVKKYGNKIKFSSGIKSLVTLQIQSNNERQILNDVTEFLE